MYYNYKTFNFDLHDNAYKNLYYFHFFKPFKGFDKRYKKPMIFYDKLSI